MMSKFLTLINWQRPKPFTTAAKNLREGDEVDGLIVERVEVGTQIAAVWYFGIPLPYTYPVDFSVTVTTMSG